jgi:hypothetical protein
MNFRSRRAARRVIVPASAATAGHTMASDAGSGMMAASKAAQVFGHPAGWILDEPA